MNKFFLIFETLIFVIGNTDQVWAECDRSRFILGAEDICWTRKVEVIERISQTQKKIVNFAKKTLGMDAEENKEPQKCDYYYCIFSEMNLLNPKYDVPCIERTTNWVKKNVKFYQATPLLARIQACSGELGISLGKKQQFIADNVIAPGSERQVVETEQSKCEIAAEYMKCLAYDQVDPECPVFQYP